MSRSNRRRPALAALGLAGLLLLGLVAADPADAAPRHLRLVKSVPMADSIAPAAPAAIRLWFSEPVELGMTRVRVEGAGAKPVATAALKVEMVEKQPVVVAAIQGTLADGAYTVSWSTASKDGHVVKGTFGFTVRTH